MSATKIGNDDDFELDVPYSFSLGPVWMVAAGVVARTLVGKRQPKRRPVLAFLLAALLIVAVPGSLHAAGPSDQSGSASIWYQGVQLSPLGGVTRVAISGNGMVAAVCNTDGLHIYSGQYFTHQTDITNSIQDPWSCSVALSNDGSTILVGYFYTNTPGPPGYAYVYSGPNWGDVQKLTPSDTADPNAFGEAVALSANGSVALVSEGGQAYPGQAAATVYIFDGSGYAHQTKLTEPGLAASLYPTAALSPDGTVAVVGAMIHGANSGQASSMGAYVFSGSGYQSAQFLNAGSASYFNTWDPESVAIGPDGGTVVVSARGGGWIIAGPYNPSATVFSGPSYGTVSALTEWSVPVVSGDLTHMVMSDCSLNPGSSSSQDETFLYSNLESVVDSSQAGGTQLVGTAGIPFGSKFGCVAALSQNGGVAMIGAPGTGQVYLYGGNARLGQVITFDPFELNPTYPMGTTVTLSATSTSGEPVSFTAGGSCTSSGDNGATIQAVTPGSCTIVANVAGDSSYAPGTGGQGFTIPKIEPTVTFEYIGRKTLQDAPFTVKADTNSDMPVTYSVTSGPCTSSGTDGSTITVTAIGICWLSANVGADNYWDSGGDQAVVYVSYGYTSISFPPLPNRTFGDPPFTVIATEAHGFGVQFTASGNCTTSGPYGSTVTLLAPGSCTVEALSDHPNWYATAAFETFAIANPGTVRTAQGRMKAASISFIKNSLNQVYNEGSHAVLVKTRPAKLKVAITYGSSNRIGPGSYKVKATVRTRGYVGAVRSSLQVNRAPLVIVPNNVSVIRGRTLPTFSWKAHFLRGDGPSTLSTQPKCVAKALLDTKRSVVSPPGTYPITCSGASANTYAMQYHTGTLTVTSG
jgi:hypothetical protein